MDDIRLKTQGASGRTRLMKAAVSAALVLLLAAALFAGAGAAEAVVVTTETDLIDALEVYGSATLGNNIQLTAEITLSSIDSTLDLNGSSLTAASNKRLFYLDSDTTFTLTDTVGGGCLVGNGKVGDFTGGSAGGGVFVNDGTFTMNGGSITGCSADDGGAVYVKTSGTFVMNGGTITGCSASNGGAVRVAYTGGSFTMNGGTITGCSASNGGAYIYIIMEVR